jgi:chorismate mutase
MQKMLYGAQLSARVFNPEVEPEHETSALCECPVHRYWKRKIDRLDVHESWSKAVMYPGEKSYHDFTHLRFFNNNPYSEITSSYAPNGSALYGMPRPDPQFHARFIEQTIALNLSLNAKAQAAVQALEPSFNIWELEQLECIISNISTTRHLSTDGDGNVDKPSKRKSFRKVLSVKTSDERTADKIKKKFAGSFDLRSDILKEEHGRWQYGTDREIVAAYQERVGLTQKVAEIRMHSPRQYLHLLRAGYFEPIPVAWQGPASNPLRFTIDSAAGWRGITPVWRGYKDTAEERLYWVLNHRAVGEAVTKPDLVRELDMAIARMASTEEPNPRYHSPDDVCHEHNSEPYSKQVKPTFRSGYFPKTLTDETMILLDCSGSMDFYPVRPNYDKYLVTGFSRSNQPKNKGDDPSLT